MQALQETSAATQDGPSPGNILSVVRLQNFLRYSRERPFSSQDNVTYGTSCSHLPFCFTIVYLFVYLFIRKKSKDKPNVCGTIVAVSELQK